MSDRDFEDRFRRIAAREDPDVSLDSDWDLRSPDQQRADYESAIGEIGRLRAELARLRTEELS